MIEERKRLKEDQKRVRHWKRWGPYLSSRQWGTVREDYSADGDAWAYFTHDMARSRAYRWGEDGIGGLCDNHQRICFAPTFWNGEDSILKERLFGLQNSDGNHGEDVKEYYYFLDNTPTHSYMKFLYKYSQEAYPYEDLIKENKSRSQTVPEYELIDTKIFDKDQYFDIFIEYAKDTYQDIAIKIEIHNRGSESAPLYILPTVWARNTWGFGQENPKPKMVASEEKDHLKIEIDEPTLGKMYFYAPSGGEILTTENETNFEKLYNKPNSSPYVKDAFHEYLIHGKKDAVNPQKEGSKIAFAYKVDIPSKEKVTLNFRLTDREEKHPLKKIESHIEKGKKISEEFYKSFIPSGLCDDTKNIQRQAFAGMLWNKQYYGYIIEKWLKGDPEIGPVPKEHKEGRNKDWTHLYAEDVFSAPDNWEYPAFFSWDMAFHTLPLSLLDAEFAKKQLVLLTREWYMHANGQLPAYEWNFCDVNPPVHAWATWRVYKIDKKISGEYDRYFLERVFQKLLMNFTWWVNRKDAGGKNIFQGGFLGLDNISVFNRSEHLPEGGELYQSDATSWMGMFCLNMLAIAFELAKTDPPYEDIASKFYVHFLHIADAINYTETNSKPLWDEEDGFYYDVLISPDGSCQHLKVRSMVGLIPLFAVSIIEPEDLDRCPGFKKRMDWFLNHRSDLCERVACMKTPGVKDRRILAIVQKDRLKRILKYMLDEKEFLSPYGLRSISQYHKENPYVLELDGHKHSVDYEPAESTLRLFGGNSNWRGPVWLPLNILLIESLQKYHYYYGDDFKVEFPTGSGNYLNLWEVSLELASRLTSLFKMGESGKRPIYAQREKFQEDPHFKDYVHFNEYFHGDTGEGLGASHQTGWTGLIAKLIQQLGEHKGSG